MASFLLIPSHSRSTVRTDHVWTDKQKLRTGPVPLVRSGFGLDRDLVRTAASLNQGHSIDIKLAARIAANNKHDIHIRNNPMHVKLC